MSVTPLRPAFTIGGSEAAACAGLDPYCSPVRLWLEKTGRVQRAETEAMRWGKLLEPVIFEALREDHFLTGPLVQGMATSDPGRAWLTGHPDNYYVTTAGEYGVVEVKTAGHWANAHGNGGPPLHYQCQVQHYLHLTGLDQALLAILVAGQSLEIHELERDQTAIDYLLAAEDEMYTRLVADMPPMPEVKGDAESLYPEAKPKSVIRETAEAREIRRELEARMEQERVVKAQVVRLKEAYQAFMGEAETAISANDWPVATWKARVDRRVNVTRLKAERAELAELFTDETHTRRFALT